MVKGKKWNAAEWNVLQMKHLNVYLVLVYRSVFGWVLCWVCIWFWFLMLSAMHSYENEEVNVTNRKFSKWWNTQQNAGINKLPTRAVKLDLKPGYSGGLRLCGFPYNGFRFQFWTTLASGFGFPIIYFGFQMKSNFFQITMFVANFCF